MQKIRISANYRKYQIVVSKMESKLEIKIKFSGRVLAAFGHHILNTPLLIVVLCI